MVEFSFRKDLGVDLEAVRHTRSWRWFKTMVAGLLTTDTALARAFAPKEEAASMHPEVPHL